MATFDKYKKNVYSQNGEDGIIEELCRRLEITDGLFVEFGAWDGKYLSNTYHLLEQGWKGVYIEGDKNKFKDLVDNMKYFSSLNKVTTIEAFIEISGDNSLDNILSKALVDNNIDLLSIDIDSYDWHVWKNLKNYQPKIVIVEINSSIPVGIFQTHRNNNIEGSSFSATVELGREKKYTLVCHTGNCIFVKDELVGKLGLPEEEIYYPELLFDYKWKRVSYEKPFPEGFIVKIYRILKKLLKSI